MTTHSRSAASLSFYPPATPTTVGTHIFAELNSISPLSRQLLKKGIGIRMALYQTPMYTRGLVQGVYLIHLHGFSVISILQMGKLDLEELRFVSVSEL